MTRRRNAGSVTFELFVSACSSAFCSESSASTSLVTDACTCLTVDGRVCWTNCATLFLSACSLALIVFWGTAICSVCVLSRAISSSTSVLTARCSALPRFERPVGDCQSLAVGLLELLYASIARSARTRC